VNDPLDPQAVEIAIPPSGHGAGIYARTDSTRGVQKAPANEVIAAQSSLHARDRESLTLTFESLNGFSSI